MTVLIDSNVALDVLLNNAGLVNGSKEVFNLAEKNRIIAYVSASAVTDIFYAVTPEQFMQTIVDTEQ